YVIKINPTENKVYLGEREDLLKSYLYINTITFHLPLDRWNKISAQIRYRSEKVPVKDLIKDEKGWKVIFEREVAGIAPGQVCAFYEGEYLIGGGIILRKT
ncbi:MAG: aminomethyltransferase beta-barrel domain-containing protein, partial [Caldimicrobium sp.]